MPKTLRVLAVSLLALPLSAQTWSRADAFPSAGHGVLTHDRGRDRIVMFGHFYGENLTWEWDGTAWSPNNTTPYPVVRNTHCLVYDDDRRVTWLSDFGSRETWSYDGRSWTQSNVPMPGYREHPHMVFDQQRGVAVMFGGTRDHHTVRDDTWEWDGAQWRMAQPPVVPRGRTGHAMAYDPVARHVLMYGGSTLQGGLLDDTWAWDGTFWVQQQAFTRPSPRWGNTMAFDPVRQRPLMFGSYNGGPPSETWEWTGNDWQQLQPATVPDWTFGSQMATHYGSSSVVLHGSGEGLTWRWDGNDWSVAKDWPAPALQESAAAADRARGKIVVFGDARGNTTIPPPTPTGTWEWDGYEWERLQPPVEPPSRSHAAMATDPLLGKTILFGGRVRAGYQTLFDTWEWNGSQWTERFPTTVPQGLLRKAMFFDGALGRNVLICDNVVGQTLPGFHEWTWDGNDWQPRPAQTGMGYFVAAGFDEARGVAVAVTSAGTFERAAGQWQQRTVGWPSFVGNFDGGGFAYDPSRQTMVGINYATSPWPYQITAWEWDGVSWTSLPSAQAHGYWTPQLLVEDPVRGRLTLIGGNVLATRFWNLTDSPAVGEQFGSACGGSAGEVTLTARGLPRTGNLDFGIDVDHALPDALVFLGVSLGEGNSPLGNGCSWYFGSPIASHILVANSAGFVATDLPIPRSTAFRGLRLASQAFAADPAGPHLGALASSAGLRIIVGD